MVQGTLPLLRHRLRRHEDGKVVATHGNMKAEVNRGLNASSKGYFLSKIMYDADLLQPLLRMDWRTRGFST